jgi:hypothetical protein
MIPVAGSFQDYGTGLFVPLISSPSVEYEGTYNQGYSADTIIVAGARCERTSTYNLGGGLVELRVRGVSQRANNGDAEYFLYSLLTSLGRTSIGGLQVNGSLYPNCMFSRGKGEIVFTGYESTVASYELSFIMSVPDSLLSSPATWYETLPYFYAGTLTEDIFYFNGVQIGECAHITSLDATRKTSATIIPRARGVRLKSSYNTTTVTLHLKAWIHINPQPLSSRQLAETTTKNLFANLGGVPATLTGNGNFYTEMSLSSFKPKGEDTPWVIPLELDFVQIVNP